MTTADAVNRYLTQNFSNSIFDKKFFEDSIVSPSHIGELRSEGYTFAANHNELKKSIGAKASSNYAAYRDKALVEEGDNISKKVEEIWKKKQVDGSYTPTEKDIYDEARIARADADLRISEINESIDNLMKEPDNPEAEQIRDMYEEMKKPIRERLETLRDQRYKTEESMRKAQYISDPKRKKSAIQSVSRKRTRLDNEIHKLQSEFDKTVDEQIFYFREASDHTQVFDDLHKELERWTRERDYNEDIVKRTYKPGLEKEYTTKEKIRYALEKDFEQKFDAAYKADFLAEEREKITRELFGDLDDKQYEKRVKMLAPNIPIQELTNQQLSYALNLPGFRFYEFKDGVRDTVNIATKSQEALNKNLFLRVFDHFQTIYKLNNSLTSLSFHAQNLPSNAFQSYLATSADAFNPVKWKRARDVLRLRDPKQVVKLGDREYTFRELSNYAKHLGVIDESFASYEFGSGATRELNNNVLESSLQSFGSVAKGLKDQNFFTKTINPFSTQNAYYQFMSVPGTNIETTQRMMLFMSSLDQGMDLTEAAENVNKYLFDYGDLTKFEENTLKRIIPFYTYMRKNIPMEIEALLNQPQKFNKIEYIQRALENADEDNVDVNDRNRWREDYFNIPRSISRPAVNWINDTFGLTFDPDDKYNSTGLDPDKLYGFDPKLPYEQLNRLDFSPMENSKFPEPRALGMLLGSTTPLVKVPSELATNSIQYVDIPLIQDHMHYKDLGRVGDLTGYNRRANATMLGDAYDEMRSAVEGVDYKDKADNLTPREKFDRMMPDYVINQLGSNIQTINSLYQMATQSKGADPYQTIKDLTGAIAFPVAAINDNSHLKKYDNIFEEYSTGEKSTYKSEIPQSKLDEIEDEVNYTYYKELDKNADAYDEWVDRHNKQYAYAIAHYPNFEAAKHKKRWWSKDLKRLEKKYNK